MMQWVDRGVKQPCCDEVKSSVPDLRPGTVAGATGRPAAEEHRRHSQQEAGRHGLLLHARLARRRLLSRARRAVWRHTGAS